MSGIHAAGYSDKLIYDDCNYNENILSNQKYSHYRLNQNPFENINKCKYDNFYHPYDLIDVESELKNITRPASQCASLKYQGMPKTGKCTTQLKPYQVDFMHKHYGQQPLIPHTTCNIDGTLYDNSLIGKSQSVPVVLPPEVCPIVYNNIPKRTCPGFIIPEYINCKM